MKIMVTLLLMLFTIPLAAANTKTFEGEFVYYNSPCLVYCTYSDSESKEKNVYLQNLKTNQKDSLLSVEVKVFGDMLYYCDNNTIKKRHLFQEPKASVFLQTEFEIDNFYIDNRDVIIAEIDTSYEKVNIKHYVDGVCSFRESVPCAPQEMEGQITRIYEFEDYYVVSVQYDLYVYYKKENKLVQLVSGCPDFSMDETGNIYFTQNSEDFLAKTLFVCNVKKPADKHEIRKSSGRTEVYSYTINDKKKGFALIGDKLYELKNQQLQPVPDIKFSINEDSEVTINEEEGNFVLSTK